MKPELMKSLQKKIPILLAVYMILGPLCRWYQLRRELYMDGGLAEGAFMHTVLLILTITFVVGIAFVLYGPKSDSSHADTFSKGLLPTVAQIVAGALLALGSFFRLGNSVESAGTYTAVSVALTKYLPYLGILAGGLVIAFPLFTGKGKTPSAVLYMLVSLYLVVQLIVHFQNWNMDPSIHDYIYKLLTAICAMLACFQIGGFSFDKGKRRLTAFWCLCTVFFAAISTPDYLVRIGAFTFFYDGSPYFINTPELLINTALLLLTLTHGLQLLFAPTPAESVQEEAPSTEEPQ